MPRLVIDTSVFVAAMFNPKSASARILALARDGEVTALWTQATRRETEAVAGKIIASVSKGGKGWNKGEMERRVLASPFDVGEKVEKPPKLTEITEDSEDDKFVACAVGGGADAIVSSDAHLLDIGEYEGIPVVKPEQFVREWVPSDQ